MELGNEKVLVDGRVFSSAAYDRGMGRYVEHLIASLDEFGFDVHILVFRNCYISPEAPLLTRHEIRFANYDPESFVNDPDQRQEEAHRFTAFLSALIADDEYGIYVDATPFLGPAQFSVLECPTIAVCYDFIPLRHPDFYLTNPDVRDFYSNGLLRLAKADHVIAISETVAAEAVRYLGLDETRLDVISPRLEQAYIEHGAAQGWPSQDSLGQPYTFQILGSHKSKSPALSMEIYRTLLEHGSFGIRVNAPKPDQFYNLQQMCFPKEALLVHSITNEQKFALQVGAAAVLHLSLEEGFGIPLLEALFLGRKVITLDIEMNREILWKGGKPPAELVLVLPSETKAVDIELIETFVRSETTSDYHQRVQDYYINHWRKAPEIVGRAINSAHEVYSDWLEKLSFKIFSSLPGANCGVADYSAAYIRSSPGNVAVFFSEGDERLLASLGNVRATTYLNYERFVRTAPGVPALFNFAFSSALYPGINLMQSHALSCDVLLIHEREYLGGLHHFLDARREADAFIMRNLNLGRGRSEASRAFLRSKSFNSRVRTEGADGFPADWLAALPLDFVHHLPPAVMTEMAALGHKEPGAIRNDLATVEDRMRFVPLGIDPRGHPAVTRAGRRLRRQRGLQGDDILLGHFGLILPDLKLLAEIVEAVRDQIVVLEQGNATGKRVFFVLGGRIIDADFFEKIRRSFAEAGLPGRLIHTNPADEQEFDAEIAACDAVFCFRRQRRGQLSHIFVRALSLGVPAIVNERSGYSYDPEATIPDNQIAAGVASFIDRLSDRRAVVRLRRRARATYEAVHRGRDSLELILRGRSERKDAA